MKQHSIGTPRERDGDDGHGDGNRNLSAAVSGQDGTNGAVGRSRFG